MIKIENIETFGWSGALRGMRNPLNSWNRADTVFELGTGKPTLGDNDRNLILNLTKAGKSHRKLLRMIHVQMDITAPLYWWKDYDTYKVGTVANGCSTMHKIHDKEFVLEDFAYDNLDALDVCLLKTIIESLNIYRDAYIESNFTDKSAWHAMIKILPCAYMQRRTVDVTYEVLLNLVTDRRYHKLQEFRHLCDFCIDKLPYFDIIYEAAISNRDN